MPKQATITRHGDQPTQWYVTVCVCFFLANQMYMHFLGYNNAYTQKKTQLFRKKIAYMHFLEVWNLKNMHFSRENAYFSGSRAKKNAYTVFIPKIQEIPKILHFSKKMQLLAAQTLTQKMLANTFGRLFGWQKNAYTRLKESQYWNYMSCPCSRLSYPI